MQQNKSRRVLLIIPAILGLAVLSCAGLSDIPNPFATETPTPTNTFTPTPTLTATTTPSPTSTPTSTPLPTGKIKEVLADGSTLFTDYDGGYQVTFPQDWTVVILEKDDLNAILANIPEQEKNVASLIEAAKKADVNNIIRAFGFNFKAQQGVYTPNLNISYDTNPLLAAISLKDFMDNNAAYFPSLGIKVIGSEIKKTASGVEIGVLDVAWTLKQANNQPINLRQKQAYFKTGDGVAVITLSTLADAKVDVNPDVDRLIESIKILDTP